MLTVRLPDSSQGKKLPAVASSHLAQQRKIRSAATATRRCAETSHTQPVVNDNKEGQLGGTGPAWGYHGCKYWLTLGNLLNDIAGEEAARESSH